MFQLVTGLPAEGGRPSAQGHDARSTVLSERPVPAPPAGHAFLEVFGEAVSRLGKTDLTSAMQTAEDHDTVAATGDALPTARAKKGGTKEEALQGKEFSPEPESKAEATDDRQSEVDDPELPGGTNMLAPLVPLARHVDNPTSPEDDARAPGMAATSLPASASPTARPKLTAKVLAAFAGRAGGESAPGLKSALNPARAVGTQHDIEQPAMSARFTANEEMRAIGRISRPNRDLPMIAADGTVDIAAPQSGARQPRARGVFPARSVKEAPLPGSIPTSPANTERPVGSSPDAKKDRNDATTVFTGKAGPAAGGQDDPPPNTQERGIPVPRQRAAGVPDEAKSQPSQPAIGATPSRFGSAPPEISERTGSAEPGSRMKGASQHGYGSDTGATAPAAQGPADRHAEEEPGRLPPRPASLGKGEMGKGEMGRARPDTGPAPGHKVDGTRASVPTNPGVAGAERKGILPAPSTGRSTSPIKASVPTAPDGAGTMSLQNSAETDRFLRPPTDPNDAPDPLLSPSTAPPAHAAQGTAAMHTNPSHMARGVAWQIASAVQSNGERSFDILLNPAELGKVRISLTPGDSGMSVHIQADRPDTLDLLRRHVGILGQDFRDLGYENTSFSFGGDGHNAHPDPQAGEVAGNPPDIDLSAIENIAESPDTSMRSAPVASGRMDIRL